MQLMLLQKLSQTQEKASHQDGKDSISLLLYAAHSEAKYSMMINKSSKRSLRDGVHESSLKSIHAGLTDTKRAMEQWHH